VYAATGMRDFITLVLVAHTHFSLFSSKAREHREMCACVGSLSNKLQMPRQRKELWAIVCKEDIFIVSLHLSLSEKIEIDMETIDMFPAEAVVGDGRSKYI